MGPEMAGTTRAEALRARTCAGSGSGIAHRALLVGLLLLLLSVCASALPAVASASIQGVIDKKLDAAQFDGAGTGVFIWDLDADQLVYERNASTPLTPASNLKLVTSAAALMDWDAAHRFHTELYAPDLPLGAGGVVDGDLYLRGLGDPSLSTKEYQREAFDFKTASFEAFARSLAKEGVTEVRGRVFGDAAWFDRLRTVPYWKDGMQLECGPLSALSANQGLDDGTNVKKPATWAAKQLRKALVGAGIRVTGRPGTRDMSGEMRLVKRQQSAALKDVLAHMNKNSDNFFAEMLLKGLGKDFYGEGSTAAGTHASADALALLGVETGSYVIQDGSGLSYDDRISPQDLVQVLSVMRTRDDFDAYYDSLAVAGKDGTLRYRMRGTAAAGNAHAKTGTLNVADGLSGYVESANGHLVAFSILMNGDPVNVWAATQTQDRIVAALAKASLPGERLLAASPGLRQFSVSATEPVHGVGGRLKPVVEP